MAEWYSADLRRFLIFFCSSVILSDMAKKDPYAISEVDNTLVNFSSISSGALDLE